METGSPNARVGTRLLLEDARTRVWEIRLAPGERVPLHRHVLDYFWTCVSGGLAVSRGDDGESRTVEYAVGETRAYSFSTGESMSHDLENAGTSELVFTTVEFVDSANDPLPLD